MGGFIDSIVVREPEWDKIDPKRRIPRDSADVMGFFNVGLRGRKFPYIPRQTPITEKEIRETWLPNRDETLTYVAYHTGFGEVLGSGTLLKGRYDPSQWNFALIVHPDFWNKGIGTAITRRAIEECQKRGMIFSLYTSVENRGMQRVMENLCWDGIKTFLKDFPPYREIPAETADVYQYVITP